MKVFLPWLFFLISLCPLNATTDEPQDIAFECPHQCGVWGSESIREVEAKVMEALFWVKEASRFYSFILLPERDIPNLETIWQWRFDTYFKGKFFLKREYIPLADHQKNTHPLCWFIDTQFDQEQIVGRVFKRSLNPNGGDYHPNHCFCLMNQDCIIDVLEGGVIERRNILDCKTDNTEGEFRLDNYVDLLNIIECLGHDGTLACLRSFYVNRHILDNLDDPYFQRQYEEAVDYSGRAKQHVVPFLLEKKRQDFFPLLENVLDTYCQIHQTCAKKHSAPSAYYNNALIHYRNGETIQAAKSIEQLITLVNPNSLHPHLASNISLSKGKIHSELGCYDKAIQALNQAIRKNPENREAFFEKAIAHFELGQVDQVVQDFTESTWTTTPIPSTDTYSQEFAQGLILGGIEGGTIGIQEFVPSMLASINGLSHALWTFAAHPNDVSLEIVQAAEDCIQYIKNHSLGEVGLKTSEILIPELYETIINWDALTPQSRGEQVGYIIGKYGVDIFAVGGLIKGFKAYLNLKKANALLTFERCAKSESEMHAILAQSIKRSAHRQQYLKKTNLKIQWDKQAKHIEGHVFYEEGKSILKHPHPERLIQEYAGTGIKAPRSGHIPGAPGYVEIVDFEEFIGFKINPDTGEKIATSVGKIHYAKDGVHVVPTHPEMYIK